MFSSKKKIKEEARQEFLEEQKKQKKNLHNWQHYLSSLLLVIAGLVFIAYTQIDVAFICRLIACLFAICGVVSIISYIVRDVTEGYYWLDLVYGAMLLFIALLFYTKQDVVESYFPVLAGIIMFANGVIKLQHSIDMKRIDRKMKKVTEGWLVVMIFALMCIAAGAITVYLTTPKQRTVFLIVGISFVVAGLTDVFTGIVFDRKVKEFKSGKTVSETDTEPETEPEPEYMPEPEYVPEPKPEQVTEPQQESVPEPEPMYETTPENTPDPAQQSEEAPAEDAADNLS
ncbi:MAG: DUF308 domain-containing protein [Lachnospiraceae bacterium]|nr:DUF308 domain-containing protein [Lachnospiraceae bacterium]